jgi:enamine deaminase RidA (YjgF/YER057c/UK114 family)
VPLENPRQTSAFAYSTTYSPRSPKFSRGLAVVQGKETTLFISGTASIVHSETQHRGDVVAQTNETLANIRALIAEENLARHGLPGRGTTLDGLAVARVYIKHPEDYAIVREVCQRCLPCVPLTFVVADVCRPDLLVEIEGMAFSRRTERAGPAEPTVSRRANQCCSGICAQSNPVPAPLCPDGCPERYYCPYAVLR